ncbi:unnamed protein product [Urochloa humidicola]
MIIRIHTRDGTDCITVPDPASTTVADLQLLIASHLTMLVPPPASLPQENALCAAASSDCDTANAYQLYIVESLMFTSKLMVFLCGRIDVERRSSSTSCTSRRRRAPRTK